MTTCAALPSRAGGGPENVFLVVNRRSPDSLAIANHYRQLRRIPENNVLDLDWPHGEGAISIDTFRKELRTPIFKAVSQRGLGRQIDYIVYSAGFPYQVKFSAEAPPGHKFPSGSLTGMTYLTSLVMGTNVEYAGLRSNWYMRSVGRPGSLLPGATLPTHGFRYRYAWASDGQQGEKGSGQHYLLCAMLAYTAGRGNSVDEAVAYLRRSAQADGTHPAGTIYYVRSGDAARSRPRDGLYASAIAQLNALGVEAELLEGNLPEGKNDVQGAMLGVANVKWQDSGSKILPGAFCDHLTSFAGVLAKGAGQTPLTEHLRHGAAGSAGTVIEPFNIINKFPHPMIHVHYARGSTLAEAFYQSVYAPYQQLLVGDPLCRPWATIPTVLVEGIEPRATLRGDVSLKPSAAVAGGSVEHFELFVDGVLRAICGPGAELPLDTEKLADGHHELRVVAVEDSPIESQGRLILPVNVDNHGRRISVKTRPERTVRLGRTVQLQADSPGSQTIAVYFNGRSIARIAGSQGATLIDTKTLGQGPVVLSVVGIGAGGVADHVVAPPIRLTVHPADK